MGESEGVAEDDSDDEDQFIARFAAGSRARQEKLGSAELLGDAESKSGAAPTLLTANDEVEEDDTSDRNDLVPNLGSISSKKDQKKARQKALLLEKSREKENMQEIVQGETKTQREAALKQAPPKEETVNVADTRKKGKKKR